MVIYADTLFAINLIFDYLALLILGKIMKLEIKQWRIFIGGAAGALGSMIIFCLDYDTAILKAVLAYIMILCAYKLKRKNIIPCFAIFLLILAAISGMTVMIISLLPLGTESILKNGMVYFDISGKLLFLILICVYPIICFVSKFLIKRKNRKIYNAVIEKSGKSVSISALFDSGNILKEPITARPVVVAEWNSVKCLFENPVEFDLLIEKAEEYKLWIIPYYALGTGNGRIFAFMADRIIVDDKVTEKVFIGVTNQKLSSEYQALLNSELI
jgi:stage II sporulation protein GA (sporulation sigma-E factor processing peptidase)